MPILEVATRTTFVLLSETPGQEIVVGTIVQAPPGSGQIRSAEEFRRISQPDYALATMNYLLEPQPDGSTRLTTETRVWATEDRARSRFAGYWRTIYPGSAFLRRMWLRAVKKRAEGS